MTILLRLFAIIIYSFIIRFWKLGIIPPFIEDSVLSLRVLSALLSVGSVFLVYLYSKNIYNNEKFALLSSWVFSVLPWTIEQGRIVSQVNNALFVFLLFLVLLRKTNKLYVKLLLFVIFLFIFYFVYPQFWLFRTDSIINYKVDYLKNFFILTSPEFLFFKNITFWWGGVRDFGIIHLSFLPFLFIGFFNIKQERNYSNLILFSIILIVSAASPFFPESREFFLSTPIISIFIAIGIYKLFRGRGVFINIIFLLYFLFLIYDISQFLHYYTVHYPQQIMQGKEKLNEAF